MAQSLNRKIKRGHAKVESIQVYKPPTMYYDPVLGAQWLTHTAHRYVIKN